MLIDVHQLLFALTLELHYYNLKGLWIQHLRVYPPRHLLEHIRNKIFFLDARLSIDRCIHMTMASPSK